MGCTAFSWCHDPVPHYSDVIIGAMASQITSLTIVYSIVYSGAEQRKHQSSASLAFVREIYPMNSPHKWPVTRKVFPFDDVIMFLTKLEDVVTSKSRVVSKPWDMGLEWSNHFEILQ